MGRSINEVFQDLRYAIRFLRRNWGFASAGVLILALGVSLTTTLVAIVNGALLEPWPYRAHDRIVTVGGNYPRQTRTRFPLWSAREIQDSRRETQLFEAVIAGNAQNVSLLYDGRPERVRAAVITPNAFQTLGVPALIGRTLQDGDAGPSSSPVVLVSYGFWHSRLGADPAVMGRELRIGNTPYQIVGVMPERFRFWDAIPEELWNSKSSALQDELRQVRTEMERHEVASQAYETAGLQILELAQTAYSSYVAKNPHEQARLIKTLVSNSTFDRGSLSPTYVKPFDVFAKGSETGDWLTVADDFRPWLIRNPA